MGIAAGGDDGGAAGGIIGGDGGGGTIGGAGGDSGAGGIHGGTGGDGGAGGGVRDNGGAAGGNRASMVAVGEVDAVEVTPEMDAGVRSARCRPALRVRLGYPLCFVIFRVSWQPGASQGSSQAPHKEPFLDAATALGCAIFDTTRGELLESCSPNLCNFRNFARA